MLSSSQTAPNFQQPILITNATDSKHIFSNLQFTPFGQSQQQPMHMPIQQQAYHFAGQQQAGGAAFISTSLPPLSSIDSIMLIKNEQQQQQHQQPLHLLPHQQSQVNYINVQFQPQQPTMQHIGMQQQQSQKPNNHPNLNKLLLSGPTLLSNNTMGKLRFFRLAIFILYL
jgi:hypothetical protein